MQKIQPRITGKGKNLQEADTDLHNAAINGNGKKDEKRRQGEFFGRILWRLAKKIPIQIAHHGDSKNGDRKNALKNLVVYFEQKESLVLSFP